MNKIMQERYPTLESAHERIAELSQRVSDAKAVLHYFVSNEPTLSSLSQDELARFIRNMDKALSGEK